MRKCIAACLLALATLAGCRNNKTAGDVSQPQATIGEIASNFMTPPDDARPGVYWYFMDGNFSKEGITKDLEAMRDQGIGYVVFLEVNVGVPRGNIDFMSEEWLDIFGHIIRECKRTGIKMVLGIGPGWTGSGGPWVKGEESMRHLVASTVNVKGGDEVEIKLEVPAANPPYFGEGSFTPKMKKDWLDYYEDVCVLAFPTPEDAQRIEDIKERALYIRHPFSSMEGVRPYFEAPEGTPLAETAPGAIDLDKVIDISDKMDSDGELEWDAPEGNWTIMRLGCRNNGNATRPAPTPGVGMECDKFSREALRHHLSEFTDKLFEVAGEDASDVIELLHLDSWEMGAQNWSDSFREEFIKRRGYDPKKYYPAYTGLIVGDPNRTERFLWDVRRTAQELVLENHVGEVKQYAREHGQKISIEPYDMNPTADLELAVSADYPMAEFWSDGFGFNTTFAVAEGTSAAHLIGQKVVPAESFTSQFDAWRQYPGSLKNQTDWALAAGINRIMFHTFQHQCLDDSLRPGMTMGPYGVHWDRGESWWPMSGAYHTYIARCQYLLRQGRTEADILYLAPESTPHVFKAPDSAYDLPGTFMPDRKGYNFDACPPGLLSQVKVKDGKIVFPSGATYRILVLPDYPTATPELMKVIYSLIKAGATVIGRPVSNSPSLKDYPRCDKKVQALSAKIWGDKGESVRTIGKGKAILHEGPTENLYPPYSFTENILKEMVPEDFHSHSGAIRHTHRTLGDSEIYFVSNRTDKALRTTCVFRVSGMVPELWNPMDGERRTLPGFVDDGSVTSVPLAFESLEGFFVVFAKGGAGAKKVNANIPETEVVATLPGPWVVKFDKTWGGPEEPVIFKELTDWSQSRDPRVKYYSGTAVYVTDFVVDKPIDCLIDLGKVNVMARVSLNGKDLGIVWTSPWTVPAKGVLKKGKNILKVEVVNLWQNRLIGDELKVYDGPAGGKWPEWLTEGTPRTSGRYTFTTWRHYSTNDPLLPSGLEGPVRILTKEY